MNIRMYASTMISTECIKGAESRSGGNQAESFAVKKIRVVKPLEFEKEIGYCSPFFPDVFGVSYRTAAAVLHGAIIFDISNRAPAAVLDRTVVLDITYR